MGAVGGDAFAGAMALLKMMAIRKHANVPGHVHTGRRNEREELGNELLRTHVDGASLSGNVETNATVG